MLTAFLVLWIAFIYIGWFREWKESKARLFTIREQGEQISRHAHDRETFISVIKQKNVLLNAVTDAGDNLRCRLAEATDEAQSDKLIIELRDARIADLETRLDFGRDREETLIEFANTVRAAWAKLCDKGGEIVHDQNEYFQGKEVITIDDPGQIKYIDFNVPVETSSLEPCERMTATELTVMQQDAEHREHFAQWRQNVLNAIAANFLVPFHVYNGPMLFEGLTPREEVFENPDKANLAESEKLIRHLSGIEGRIFYVTTEGVAYENLADVPDGSIFKAKPADDMLPVVG